MKTYAVRGARTQLTGHYRRPGTRDLYCNRPAGAPNDYARGMARFKLCTRCVKAETRDRAEATATAEAWLDDTAAAESADRYIAKHHPKVAEFLATERARETAGTWRAEWIGTRATSPAPTLFDVEPDAEQGALFA